MMTASSRGSRAAASFLRTSRRSHPHICSDCISHIRARFLPISTSLPTPRTRSYAVAATSLKTLTPEPDSELQHLSSQKPISSTSTQYVTKAGILLSRAPLLTAPQTSFEKAFYFYQKRLNERLAMPWARYFYFKKGTPSDADRKLKEKERNGSAARELGGYRAYGDEAWHDELLSTEADAGVSEETAKLGLGKMGIAEPKYLIESLVKDAKVRAVEGKDGQAVEVEIKEGEDTEGKEGVDDEFRVEKPLSRFTESDRKNDLRKLDRKLARTLYLLVKNKSGVWGFPRGDLEGRENLHQAAERILVQSAGLNMNTWIIGHVPVGYHVSPPRLIAKHDTSTSSSSSSPTPEPELELQRPGAKTFFMKGRIMAGQADLAENHFGLTDYKWLTKEEVQKHVTTSYWAHVKNMMADK
ncbi:related to mitochondrial ribosomal protein L17 [Rhynchosporium agropyri]|uniref:Large ribosomal subunit protein mL46 n=1 Tax=Rhynchosporium agropyri TaxID=914238 RepID=A0A1E1KZ09_9HELO|nr:related to mitochondrial ribosomal protein L17 [Rhynchosporium agropyri]